MPTGTLTAPATACWRTLTFWQAQFAAEAPPQYKGLSKADDPHQFHLNRLAHELELRKAMHVAEENVRARKKTVAATNAEKEAFIAGLPAVLASVEAATGPLQKYMEAPISEGIVRQKRARELPPPLYVLFAQLEGFIASEHTRLPVSEQTIPESETELEFTVVFIDEDEEDSDNEDDDEKNDEDEKQNSDEITFPPIRVKIQ